MAGTVLQAFIFRDGEFLGTEMITGDKLDLGRDLSCDLVIEDEQVSRRHARVQMLGGQLYIKDLNSANGTTLNGEPLTEAKPLTSRDDVFIGCHVVKFKILSSGKAAAPAPAAMPGAQATAAIPQARGPVPQPTSPMLTPDALRPPAPAYAPDTTLPDAIPPGPPQHSFDSPSGMHQPRSDPWKDLRSSPAGGSDPAAAGGPAPIPGLPAAGAQSGITNDPLQLEDELFSDLTNIPGHGDDPLAAAFQPPSAPPSARDDKTLADAGLPASAMLADQFFPDDHQAAPPAPPAPIGPPAALPELTEPSRAPTADLIAAAPSALAPDPTDAPTRAVKNPLAMGGAAALGEPAFAPPPPPPPPPDFDEGIGAGLDFEPVAQLAEAPAPQPAETPALKATAPSKPALEEPEPALRRAPVPVDVDDEDYDPDDEPAPFSLFENLLKEKFKDGRVPQVKKPVLEVVRYQSNVVSDLTSLGRGQIFTVGAGLRKKDAAQVGVPANFKLAKLRRDGSADLIVLQSFKGKVVLQGAARSLQDAATWKGEKGSLRLTQGDLANLQIGPDQYFVRFAFPPALLRKVTRRSKPTGDERRERRWSIASFGSSVGVHLSVLLVLFVAGLISPPQLVTQLEEDRFVQLDSKELELEKPPEEEEPEEMEEVEEAPPEDTPKPQKRLSHPSGVKKKPGILAALGKIPKRSGAAGSQTLTAAVSNLDAVKVPGGGASYKVTGLIGKGPTNRVRIGGSGGGVATKGLASILREGGGGPGKLSKLKGGGVRGRLVKASRGSKLKGKGYLDRAEIQKVVNKGLGQIQFCYEKELLKNQSLSGKVIFEWTISTSGSVSIVKTTTSTLKSAAAVTCMIGAIKRWKFPKPRGNGTVIVTYPFIFNAMGF